MNLNDQTYNAEEVVGMTFAAEDADTGLFFVGCCEAPYPDGRVIRRRRDDERVIWRRHDVIDALSPVSRPVLERYTGSRSPYSSMANKCLPTVSIRF